MMPLKGKGFFTWELPRCDKGDPQAIARAAKNAKLSHVLVKIADGVLTYNGRWGIEEDLVTPVVHALRTEGIEVWGWHYVYGENPIAEANRAIRRIRQYDLDGYVIDAEKEYKEPGKETSARRFMSQLRSSLPDVCIALSSYRFPSLHPQIPWKEFLDKCDFSMPQVYWMKAHNPGEQLVRCIKEYSILTPSRPIVPTGAAFIQHGWQSTPEETVEFMRTAQDHNLSAVNYWEWSNARSEYMPGVWDSIATYPWSGEVKEREITDKYISALNTHDPDRVISLYHPAAVHITGARTVQGKGAIRTWYQTLFTDLLPEAEFNKTGYLLRDNSRHFNWIAKSSLGKVENGNDTFGLQGDKINYHYSFFTVDQN
jgi:hypothetical protein